MGTPTRTCIGCRQRGPATAMVRLTVVDGRLVPWAGARPAGRGASIHADERCVGQAVKKGAFSRAFRTRVDGVEVSELLRRMAQAAPTRQTTIGRTQT